MIGVRWKGAGMLNGMMKDKGLIGGCLTTWLEPHGALVGAIWLMKRVLPPLLNRSPCHRTKSHVKTQSTESQVHADTT
eukprot:1717731-Amphidinium_carterae.1